MYLNMLLHTRYKYSNVFESLTAFMRNYLKKYVIFIILILNLFFIYILYLFGCLLSLSLLQTN